MSKSGASAEQSTRVVRITGVTAGPVLIGIFSIAVTAAVAALWSSTRPLFVAAATLSVLTAAAALGVVVNRWLDHRAVGAFRRLHMSAGRDILIVYSSSPHWESYIEKHWLGRWSNRAVVLNRSEPDWQLRLEATLWRRVAGAREHTPVVIVVPPKGRPTIVRFFLAFRDYKHGRESALREKEAELERAVSEIGPCARTTRKP